MTQATSRLNEPAEECYDTLDQVSYCYNTLDQVSCCYDTLDQASCYYDTLDQVSCCYDTLDQVSCCYYTLDQASWCYDTLDHISCSFLSMLLIRIFKSEMKWMHLHKKEKKLYFVKTEFCSSYSFLFYWIVSQFTKFVPFINQTITHILNSMGIVKKESP
jgi:hypothetical protein